MYKNVCVLFVCCSSNIFKKGNSCHYSNKDDDKILWSSKKKLVWDDFKGIPDTSSTNIGALTSSEIEIVYNETINGVPKYLLKCHFIKSKSWTRVNDIPTLLHEQLHFDIDELFTRKVRKAFDSLNKIKIEDFEIYNNTYTFYGEKCDKYQNLYDSQVYFNDENQQQWIKKIGAELAKLKRYEYIPEE
jgi:hypothetical protein